MKIQFIFLLLLTVTLLSKENIIVDSKMTFEEAIKGTDAPKEIIENLVILDVKYYGFDKKIHQGQIVIHKDLQKDVVDAFELMLEKKFPIKKVIPIIKYKWDDIESMKDNNTSAFNYRVVAGTNRLSNHALGRAIDINPFTNPAIYSDGKISPPGAKYNPNSEGAINTESEITLFFKNKNYRWGGDWTSLKDYQHFDLPAVK